MSDSLTFGIAIPAYKNPERLRRCLLSIQRIAPELLSRTTVVDDSGDGQVAKQLSAEYPMVCWVVHEKNLGFGKSSNDAVANRDSDIVILLNDDTELVSLSLESLQQLFREPETIAVTFQSVDEHGKFREGAKRLVWHFGFPRALHNPKDQRKGKHGRCISDYAVGGHAAFRRDYFLRLQGFDSLFDPFYWEDVDLAARALQNGWKSYYSADCIVKHANGGAIRTQHESNYIYEMTMRNRILFARRHVSSSLRLILPITLQFIRLQSSLLEGGNFGRALRAANEQVNTLATHEP